MASENISIKTVLSAERLVYYLAGVILFTQVRGALLIIMPLVPFVINRFVPFSISKNIIRFLGLIILLSTVCGILMGWDCLENVLLFYWLFIPILLLFYAKPLVSSCSFNIHDFFTYTFHILAIVDLIGFVVWLRIGGDEFGSGYGRHYEYVHGLSFINLFYFFYYLLKVRHHFSLNKDLYKTLFLFISFVLCDFGLAWITLFGLIIGLLLMRMKLRNMFIILIFSVGSFALLQTDKFEYEKNNIELVLNNSDKVRKIVMFKDLPKFMSENELIPWFGTGPGGYNSRATVLLSGDNKNLFTSIMGDHQPKYYKKYIYPLWNNTFVSQDSYTDGTRNKPYSSFVSLLTELGLFAFCMILYSFASRIFFFHRHQVSHWLNEYLKILYIFMFISLLIHDWIISTEFIVFLLINILCLKTIALETQKESSLQEITLDKEDHGQSTKI